MHKLDVYLRFLLIYFSTLCQKFKIAMNMQNIPMMNMEYLNIEEVNNSHKMS